MRTLARKPASWAKRVANARKDLGDPEKAKALALSRIANQIHPLIARTDGTLIDGFRTIWGLELLARLDAELDFLITEGGESPQQIALMQGVSAIHREDWKLADKCEWVIDLLKTIPAKDIAVEIGVDPAMVSNWRAYDKLIPEAKQAVRDGKVDIRSMGEIAKLPPEDQPVLLNLRLGGAGRDEMKAARKKRGAAPTVSVSRIKIELGSGLTVTISGSDLNLDQAIDAVKDAQREMTKGRDIGLDAKTIVSVARDKARNGS